jgi:ribosomal subunit interface protein
MTLRVSGKNMDIGDALRTYVLGRVNEGIGKYYDGGFGGHVTVEREGSGFRTECTLHLDTGVNLQSLGSGQDAYPSVDQAVDRIEKRLRRYKRKLKDYHGAASRHMAPILEAAYSVIEAPDPDDEMPADYHPVVIAETTKPLKQMSVDAAVMELDLTGSAFIAFRHAKHGGMNIVYRRADGNIGWIDPSLDART